MCFEEIGGKGFNPPAPLIRGVEEITIYFVNRKEVFPLLKLGGVTNDFRIEFFGDAVEGEAVVGGENELLFQPETFLEFFNVGQKFNDLGGDVVNEFRGFKIVVTIC